MAMIAGMIPLALAWGEGSEQKRAAGPSRDRRARRGDVRNLVRPSSRICPGAQLRFCHALGLDDPDDPESLYYSHGSAAGEQFRKRARMMRRRCSPRVLFVALLSAALVGAQGCGKRGPASSTDSSVEPPRKRVAVARPQRETIRRTVTEPGQIEAFNQARLFAKIPAYVEKYYVDIGRYRHRSSLRRKRSDSRARTALAKAIRPRMASQLRQKRARRQAEADVQQAQAAIKVATQRCPVPKHGLNEALAAIASYSKADFERWDFRIQARSAARIQGSGDAEAWR